MTARHFVGREREIARLGRELDLAQRRPGRVVLVTADPGVGKTRVLAEFRERVGRRALVLVGRGSPLAATIPLGIVAEPLEARLASLSGQDRGRLAGAPLDAFATILRGSADGGAAASGLQALGVIRDLLVALAVHRPVVVVLDDLHQADRSSWDLVAYLARNLIAGPVLLVASSRIAPLVEVTDFADTIGALVKDGIAPEIRLDSFGPQEVAALAEAVLGPAVADAELVEWLFDRARGNALFTTALLEDLAIDPSSRVVPVNVQERVRQMRARLPEPGQRVLDIAAVLGHSFSLRTIAPLLGPEAAQALELLVADSLLVQRPDGYDFAHPLLREAVYENLGPARRRELHQLAATSLVAEPLAVRAYHVARGALPGDTAAVETLRAAAGEAERLQAPREALGHLTAALSLTPPGDPVRRELLDEIGWQAGAASDHTTGIAALQELVGLVRGDPQALASAKMRLASFLSTGAADVEGAERAATEAIDLLRGRDDVNELAAALNERAWIRGMAGDFRGQLEGCREALALAEEGGDPAVVLHTIGPMAGVLALLGDFGAADALHPQALALAGATGDRGQIGWHAAVASLTELYRGRFERAAAVLDPAVDPAPLDADIGAAWRTLTDWFLGRWAVGRIDCAVVRQIFPIAPSAHMAWAFSMAALFEVGMDPSASSRGAGSESLLRQAERTYGDRHLYFFTALHHWAAGCVRWLSGDLEAAERHLARSARWLRETGAIGFEGLLLAERPEVLVGLEEVTEAERQAERAREVATRLGTPFASAQAAYVAGVVAQARHRSAEASATYAAAAQGAEAAPAPFLRGRALERLAEVAPADRVNHLREAARSYASLPAPALRDRALAELRSLGSQGRRAAQRVGALTAREQEVATLAARGLSTLEIANRLHVSKRTVESHLDRAYRKLGIDGRSMLAEALGSRGRS